MIGQIQIALPPCPCKQPQVCVMDYEKSYDRDQPDPRINRACTKCWTHWYGHPDAVKIYTRKEWDDWMASAFQEDLAEARANS